MCMCVCFDILYTTHAPSQLCDSVWKFLLKYVTEVNKNIKPVTPDQIYPDILLWRADTWERRTGQEYTFFFFFSSLAVCVLETL